MHELTQLQEALETHAAFISEYNLNAGRWNAPPLLRYDQEKEAPFSPLQNLHVRSVSRACTTSMSGGREDGRGELQGEGREHFLKETPTMRKEERCGNQPFKERETAPNGGRPSAASAHPAARADLLQGGGGEWPLNVRLDIRRPHAIRARHRHSLRRVGAG